jgi:hypothetical protein
VKSGKTTDRDILGFYNVFQGVVFTAVEDITIFNLFSFTTACLIIRNDVITLVFELS